jgi:hypothetical protein
LPGLFAFAKIGSAPSDSLNHGANMTTNKSAVDISEVRKRRAEILRQYSDDAIFDSFEAGWRAV